MSSHPHYGQGQGQGQSATGAKTFTRRVNTKNGPGNLHSAFHKDGTVTHRLGNENETAMDSREMSGDKIAKRLAPEHHETGKDGHSLATHLSLSDHDKKWGIQENHMKKSLSYLIEAEMDKATVLMASKGVTDRLQQMAEQVAMMVAKDVMPLGDTMRDVFGVEAAKAFQAAISEKLNSLVSSIGDVKDSINDQIDALENGGSVSDLDTSESTDDLFGDDDAAAAESAPEDEDFAADVGVEQRDKKDDMSDLDDVFSDAPEGGMGRGMKEGAQPRKRITSGDSRVAREFANLMREGKDVTRAARMIAETYNIDLSTVAKIIAKVNKK